MEHSVTYWSTGQDIEVAGRILEYPGCYWSPRLGGYCSPGEDIGVQGRILGYREDIRVQKAIILLET